MTATTSYCNINDRTAATVTVATLVSFGRHQQHTGISSISETNLQQQQQLLLTYTFHVNNRPGG